ncbi:MAG: hypothetical protein AAB776_00280 [Patescibacteria group bacterium]
MKKLVYFQVLFILGLAVISPKPVSAANVGDLITCSEFSTVYFLGEDGQRHPFPNEQTFHSWYNDFHDVVQISCDDLATIQVGSTVVYQAGTRLVKLPSVPTVYAVEDDGVLRALSSEEQAETLFGEDWAERVDDLSEAFWPDFDLGAPLIDGEIPEGTVLRDDEGSLFRVEGDEAIEVDAVLDTDQEDNLQEHALELEDLEDRLGVALALIHVDADQAATVLAEILEKLQVIDVDDDDEAELDDIDELDADDADDADDAISDAQEEIAEAESDILEDQEDGKDISASEVLLAEARVHLAAAEAALAVGDFALAEDHADEAKHAAMWARGKAVSSIDDGDDSDEDEAEDDDIQDESEDESESEDDSSGEGDGDEADDESV